MILKAHIAKRVRALLEEVNGAVLPWSAPAVLEAGKLLPYFQGTRRKPPSKKLPKHLQSRRPAKAKIHKENTRALRAAVMERAQGTCELCGWRRWPMGLEMHHLLSGSGRRREQQSVATCMAICRDCHRDHHNGVSRAAYMAGVSCWAKAHGYPVPVNLKGTARSAL